LRSSDANKNKNGTTRDKTLIVVCEDRVLYTAGSASARMVFITVHCFRVSGRREKKSELLQTHKSNKSKKENSKTKTKKTRASGFFFFKYLYRLFVYCLRGVLLPVVQ
jgi:hypothetical protein